MAIPTRPPATSPRAIDHSGASSTSMCVALAMPRPTKVDARAEKALLKVLP